MMQKRLWSKPGHARPFGTKCHKHHRNPGGAPGQAVRFGVAKQKGTRQIAARPLDGLDVRRRIGLAHDQRIGPDERIKKIAHAQPLQQGFGQRFGLVGANRCGKARGTQSHHRLHRAGIKKGVPINVSGIGPDQIGKCAAHIVFAPRLPDPIKPQPQHRPRPLKRRQRIRRGQLCPVAHRAKAGIGRRQQVSGGIRKGSVQIKHHAPHFVTPCEGSAPCYPVNPR